MIPKVPNHKRIKPKRNIVPNASEKAYHDHVRSLPCLVCGKQSALHHVISNGFKQITKNHMLCVPLCYEHHQGDKGYHGLGSHDLFMKHYRIHTFDEAMKILAQYQSLT